MQTTKDTFYELLRTRLASLNPERTIILRGATRPAILVEANELPTGKPLLDCFRLRWLADTVNPAGPTPLATLQCEIAYSTAGTALNAGMDRGRTLTALDGELLAIVNTTPQRAPKHSYTQNKDLTTNLWWSDLTLGPVTAADGTLARTATVTVMSYTERGEQ